MAKLNDALKRALDMLVAGFALAASIPCWLAVGAAILLEDGRPILYRQTRVGRGGRIFGAYKFRSMIREAEKGSGPRLAAVDDPRITWWAASCAGQPWTRYHSSSASSRET